MGDIIKLNRTPTCDLRTRQELYSRNPKTVQYGTETIFLLALCCRNHISFSSKNLGNRFSKHKKLHLSFIIKINIRKWKPDCPCRLCKFLLKHVGFIKKIIKATKNLENIRTFSLLLSHFEPMLRGSLGFLLFLGHIQKPVSLFSRSNEEAGFSMSCRIAGGNWLQWNVGSN